ncbi:MAG: DUF3048 domain-containing protein [Candidatus Shapirobacteria bacterium]|jgi:hypothetical protein
MSSKLLKLSFYSGMGLIIFGISYFLFSSFLPTNISTIRNDTPDNSITPTPVSGKKTGYIVFSGPKTEICPLNGEKFTKEEKDIWSTRRPLMVMIENHVDSRPQSGLQNADIVYEAVAEGGITRFMGVYYCNAVRGAGSKYDIGPVRSARTYYLDLASEFSDYPLYAHVGGANCSAPIDPATGRQAGPCTTNKKALAIEQISDYGWNNKGTWSDLSQFSLSYKACRREPDRTGQVVATEHSMYCSTTELWNVAASRGLTDKTTINNTSWNKNYKQWSFTQKDEASASPSAGQIAFDFWSSEKDYSVVWKYDKNTNSYLRENGGKVHIDFNIEEPLRAKNIIVQHVKETRSIDEHAHNLYAVIGTGTGYLFQNGNVTELVWSKVSRSSRTTFKDKTGKEINLIPGQIWVEILPLNSKVNYEGPQQP